MNERSIAITAMGCRYPGGVTSPGDLWRLVDDAVDATGPFPADRIHEEVSYRGGFLDDAAEFEPRAFGMSPREAELTDPQQRVALQVASQTLRSVGLGRADLHGSATGVFIGAMAQEYGDPMYRPDGSGNGYGLTGTSPSVISGRIAYHFGLTGPAITVDTACSASLVAIHQAVRALRDGSCEQALAGGVTVMPTPGLFADFAQQGGMAADGKCKAFSAQADGVAWAEGCGLLLLETVEHARAHGRTVLAVLSGIAINQDGASNGLTAPNGKAQEQVVKAALADADLRPELIHLLEAHGTGTPLGDAIEVKALARTYGRAHRSGDPVFLGSVKSNFGHAQAAAGVGGVIKVVEAMRHGRMPSTLHVDEPTTQIDWEESGLELLSASRAWPAPAEGSRHAAVSSFGISGTNAHVVLTEGDPVATGDDPWAGVHIAHVSGETDEEMRTHARRVLAAVEATPDDGLPTLLAGTRAHPPREHCVAVLADAAADLADGLRSLCDGRDGSHARKYISPALVRVAPDASDPVLVFPGQGAQWAGMVDGLYRSSASFRRHFDTCAEALDRHAGPNWRQALNDPEVQRPDWLQPALFATTVSLARTWLDLGMRPRAVVGSSQGEIAAAHIAGVLDLEDAATIVCRRSALIHELAPPGGMVSIRAGRTEVDDVIARYAGQVEVAVENAPNLTVVAGERATLAELLEQERAESRRIAVDYASHTAAMDVLEEELAEALADIRPHDPVIPIVSTLTGDRCDTGAGFDADYWFANLRRTVRFRTAIDRVVDDGARVFLEVSPHPVMGQAITDILDDAEIQGVTVGSLLRDSGGKAQLAVTAAALGLTALDDPAAAQEAPPPVARTRRLWSVPTAPASATSDAGLIDLPDGRRVGTIDVAYDWVDEHRVAGRAIAPGTLLVSALAALFGPGTTIDGLTLQAPITRETDSATVVVEPRAAGHHVTVSIPAPAGEAAEGDWITVASGTLRDAPAEGAAPAQASDLLGPVPDGSGDVTEFYETLAARGYGYGPVFRGVRSVELTPTTALAEVAGPPELPWSAGTAHPIHLDTMLHVALPLLPRGLWVPYRWRSVDVGRPASGTVRVLAELVDETVVRLRAEDSDGAVVFAVEELRFAPLDAPDEAAALSRLVWDEVEPEPAGQAPTGSNTPWEPIDRIEELPHRSTVLVDTGGSRLEPIALTEKVVGLIRDSLQRAECDLVLITHQAVAVDEFDTVRSLSASPLVGLVRSAAVENPGRVRLLDLDEDPRSSAAVEAALASGDVELAIRRGRTLRPHLAGADADTLDLGGPDWRIDRGERSTIEDIAATPNEARQMPLEEGQVRVDVRATGLNFRDVTVALGMLSSELSMGCEVAGAVAEVGPGVEHMRIGDRVFGLADHSIAPVVVADASGLRPLPDGWTWSDGAAAVIAGVTALRSLEIAGVGAGDKVLVHAATGGVGQVLVALARAMGAEVYATAHPDKHHLLRRRGLDAAHCSTSRSADFEQHFGVRMDAVVNCLSGLLTDASLRLLRPGGSFVEIGKTDIRDAETVQAEYGVDYVAYNVLGETPADVGDALDRVVPYLEAAELDRHAVDVRYVQHGVRRLRHAQHPGKLVLSVPRDVDDLGTCLITGGTSGLGALCAEHLLRTGRTRRVVLVSRRGPDTPGVDTLLTKLRGFDGDAEIRVCDIGREDEVRRLVDDVRPDTVIHAAGTLQDGPVEAMEAEQLRAVMEPKVLGALNLDRATRGLDLKAFVLFSSAVGCLGSPGQANYAAANTFLESLASVRRQTGLPATCINWGLWAEPTGMTSHLGVRDIEALARRTGLCPVPTSTALTMLDRAIAGPITSPVAARFADHESDASQEAPTVPDAGPSVGQPEGLDLLTSMAADILGYTDPGQIDPTAAYRDLGFDSLLTIDLRNRIGDRTGKVLKVEQILAAGTLEALASVVTQPGEGSTPSRVGV